MTTLRTAAQQALEALEEIADEVFSPYDNKLGDAILALRAALAQKDEPVWMHPWPPVRAQQDEPQTLNDAMRLPRAMARAYENGYKAGQAHERERCLRLIDDHVRAVDSEDVVRAIKEVQG